MFRAPFRLSCPTKALCVAVDGAGNALVSTNPTGGAAAWSTTNIDATNPIAGVSCPSRSLCVAVDDAGNALVSTNPTGGAAAWRTTNVDGTTKLSGVTCPSVTLCVAVGGRDVAVSTDPAGGSSAWTVLLGVDETVGPECGKYAPDQGCAAHLTDISCSSVSLCVGLDNWGQLISSRDPAGGLSAWSRGGTPDGPDLSELSCRTDASCVGVCSVGFGLLGQDCPGSAYGNGDAVVWSPGTPLTGSEAFSTIAPTPLSGMWCPLSSVCFASNAGGRLLASATTPALGGSGWATVLNGSATNHAYDPIDDVSCPSPSSCVAIDNDSDVFVASSGEAQSSAASVRSAAGAQILSEHFRKVGSIEIATKPMPARIHPAAQRVLSALRWRYVIPEGRPLATVLREPRQPEREPMRRDRLGDRTLGSSRAGAAADHAPSNDLPRAVAAATSATGYGLATPTHLSANTIFATCTVNVAPCPSGDLEGWFNRTSPSSFTQMRSSLPLQYARFFVPYDALMSWNGSTCAYSPAETSGVGYQAFQQLVWQVQAAEADHLTPVVAFSNGTGAGGIPTIPDPGYGTASSAPYSSWTVAAQDYACGVYGIMAAIGSAGLGPDPVVDWEAWNEPNGAGEFNGALSGECSSSSSPCGGAYNSAGYLCYSNDTACGPLEAAELWEIAQALSTGDFASKSFSIAAMTVSDAQNSPYETSYIAAMQSMTACASGYYCGHAGPNVWSIHDYDDPSSGVPAATADIKRFATTLDSHWAKNQTVWITESGVALEDGTTGDNNCKASSANCGPLKSSNCAVGLYPHLDNTFGACVDGSASAEAAGAGSVLALAAAAASDTQTVTQVDWYEFQAPNASTGWDSGLVSPPSGGYASPDGVYNASRSSLCVLDHRSTSQCSGSALDSSDWSTNQYQAAHP
jgi:hypothetical protein